MYSLLHERSEYIFPGHEAMILLPPPGGGDSAYENGGGARWRCWIKPLKETDLGVAHAFFDPLKRPCWNIDNISHVQP